MGLLHHWMYLFPVVETFLDEGGMHCPSLFGMKTLVVLTRNSKWEANLKGQVTVTYGPTLGPLLKCLGLQWYLYSYCMFPIPNTGLLSLHGFGGILNHIPWIIDPETLLVLKNIKPCGVMLNDEYIFTWFGQRKLKKHCCLLLSKTFSCEQSGPSKTYTVTNLITY